MTRDCSFSQNFAAFTKFDATGIVSRIHDEIEGKLEYPKQPHFHRKKEIEIKGGGIHGVKSVG